MSNKQQAAQGSAAAAKASVTYRSMNIAQKIAHICKVCVFFITFGFAYPNIFTD